MPRDQFVVARRRLVAQPTGHTANLTQDAGELSSVIGIVGGDRQWAQPGDRRVGLTQGSPTGTIQRSKQRQCGLSLSQHIS